MNLLFKCILLVKITHAVSSQEVLPLLFLSTYDPDNSRCQVNDGIIGCTDDCLSQEICINQQIYEVKCKTNSFCDKKTLKCVENQPEVCINEKNFNCVAKGYYPHILSCHKYYLCDYAGAQARVGNCKESFYDPTKEQCVPSLPCYNFSPEDGLCQNNPGKLVVHPLNKRYFAYCVAENGPILGACKPGYLFNTANAVCEFECKFEGRQADPATEKCYYDCDWEYHWGHKYRLIAKQTCCENNGIYDPAGKGCVA